MCVHFLNWILQVNFCSNHVRSSKYTIFSFLILNLLEQFRRSANFCYLCIAIIQVTSVLLSKTKTVLHGHYHKPSFYKAPIYFTVWKVNIYNQFSTVDTFSHTQCQWNRQFSHFGNWLPQSFCVISFVLMLRKITGSISYSNNIVKWRGYLPQVWGSFFPDLVNGLMLT